MRQFSIILICTITFVASANSQKVNWLRNKFQNADTVLIVSHEATAGVTFVDSFGKHLPLPKLVVANRPNYSIFKERQILAGTKLDNLIKILDRPFQDSVIERGNCFIPHHAILVIKSDKTSYVDICFGCRGFDVSKDMRRISAFDRRKWGELEGFFLSLGFKDHLVTDE